MARLLAAGGAAVIVVVIVVAVVLTGRTPTPVRPATSARSSSSPTASPATIGGAALASLVHPYAAALTTETAANRAYVAGTDGTTADMTRLERRIQQDAFTDQADRFGLSCNAADLSTYETCVQGDERAAAEAENDETAAQAQIQRDEQQYSSLGSAYETALSRFVSQVTTLPWPPSMTGDAGNLLDTARLFRSDVADQAAVNGSTPPATVSVIAAQTGADAGNLTAALGTIRADLARLGAAVP